MKKLRAAILGLGKIGIGFDLKENRSTKNNIWTHYAAYKELSSIFDLVLGVDLNKEVIKECLHFDQKIVWSTDVKDIEKMNIDVLSICTPEAFHFDQLLSFLPKVKGIYIEKPLFGLDVEFNGLAMEQQLCDFKKPIYVNYYKRDEPSVLRLKDDLKSQKIQMIQCRYGGELDVVASHAIDLLHFINPIDQLLKVHQDTNGHNAIFSCEDGVSSYLINVGNKFNLIFELEVITNHSRYILSDNLSRFRKETFIPSQRFLGYKELSEENNFYYSENPNRLVKCLRQIYQEVLDGKPSYQNLIGAIKTQSLMQDIKNMKDIK